MDYLSFFNLNEDPFRLTPDPFFFYHSQEHNDALLSLDYAVKQMEGFSLIIGEPGTGKTTILKVFIDRWKDKAEIALIMTPRLSPEDFLQAVLEDLNVHINTNNKNEMVKAFRNILVEHTISGRRVIIVVDEVQNLPYETLEELRLLSNLETEKAKLLQIMLIGQPEFKNMLASENLKQLDQRIAVKVELNSLNIIETQDYINFRLRKAGKGSAIFENDAIKLIYKLSKGIPRLINILSSRSLMAACIEGANVIKKIHVEYAKQHLSYNETEDKKKVKLLRYALIGSITVILVFIFFGFMHVNGFLNRKQMVPFKTAIAPIINQEESIKKLQKRIITVVADANLREMPSKSSDKISGIPKGTILETIEEYSRETGEKWYRVKMHNGNNGWISERAVITVAGGIEQ